MKEAARGAQDRTPIVSSLVLGSVVAATECSHQMEADDMVLWRLEERLGAAKVGGTWQGSATD